ncbi:hypothetical protein [Persicitalea sp.]|uniref:hypothetical protein n=1 Tax=Persicitalea sp. TaxID=3100273 RepID=UPI00359330ED
METSPTNPPRPENPKPSGIVHLSEEDIAYLHANKTKISSGMKMVAVCMLILIFYRIISDSSETGIMLSIGFAIMALLGIGLFWFLFARRVDKALTTGTKHVGRARIVRKFVTPPVQDGPPSFYLFLDWDFKDKIPKASIAKEMYTEVSENDLVEIEIVTSSKFVIKVRKLPEQSTW